MNTCVLNEYEYQIMQGCRNGIRISQICVNICLLQKKLYYQQPQGATYKHSYTHTYIHTYTHTYIYMYVRTYVHRYIDTYIYTIHTYIQTCKRTCIQTFIYRMHTYKHAYTCILTHACMHAYINTVLSAATRSPLNASVTNSFIGHLRVCCSCIVHH